MTEVPTERAALIESPVGFRGAWRRLLDDGLAERELIRSLFRRNFLNKFAGSGLGFVWLIVMPCLPIFIYNILQLMDVFADPVTGIPRAVFLTLGLILYYGFSETVNHVTAATAANRHYIVQSGVPKMAIVFSICIEVAANFGIRYAVFLALMFVTIGVPSWTILTLPLFFVPLVVLGLALGLVLNLFAVLYADVLNVVQVASFYLLFASGVFVALPEQGTFFAVLRCSPVYQIVVCCRKFALEHDASCLPQAGLAALAGIIILPISVVAFYRAEKLVNSYL